VVCAYRYGIITDAFYEIGLVSNYQLITAVLKLLDIDLGFWFKRCARKTSHKPQAKSHKKKYPVA
jgi:hypothetical protein